VFLEIQQTDFWNGLLGPKGQAAAAWIYTIATAVLLYFVVRQVKHAQSQLQQVEKQLLEMRSARDLESFVTFIGLWEDPAVRAARRHVYDLFGPALRAKDPLQKQLEFEKAIGNLSEGHRQAIDIVINKGNSVGLLWAEHLLSESMRRVVLPYIYKTVIQTWTCLEPYVQQVRKERGEQSPASINYAAPFETLWKEADLLRKSRKEEIPVPPPSCKIPGTNLLFLD
jgi:hypothetical protein